MDSVPNKRTVEERIAEALSQKQRLLSDQKVLLQKYNKLQREIDNYSAMFLANEEVEEKVVSKNNPIIIGNAHTRMSILDIGKIDTTNTIIKNGHILPKGYRAKRKYKSHNECPKKTADGKIFYFCNVNNEWSIECTCGKEYREFETFTNDFEECDITTVEEFFGLTHPSVIGMIEEMVDVDKVEGYTRHNDKK